MTTFPKKERLTGEIRINTLFEQGKSFISYPFRVGYMVVPKSDVPVKVLIGVPKKRFKHAVDRNRIKRLFREVYRLNKDGFFKFVQEKNYSLHLVISYVSSDIITFELMQESWLKTIEKLIRKLSQENE